MANNERIDSIIDEKAFLQLEKAVSLLVNTQGELVKATQEAKKFNEAVGNSKSVSDFVKAQENASKAIDKVSKSAEKTRLEEIKLQQAREKAFDDYEKNINKQISKAEKAAQLAIKNSELEIKNKQKERLEEIRLQQAREKNIDNYNKQLAKQDAALAKSENLYNKVQAKVNSLSQTYNNLAIKQQLGLKLSVAEEAQLLSLEKRLNTYQSALIKVDAQIQKNGRNVGNYASGFSPLNNAIGQISRELPNFGQSFQVGVLSLTNNIGALQDAISGIIAQNKILISQGSPTKNVFSQILGSVLSFNTGLFVAIGLFSAYSKEISEFLSDLFKVEEKLSQTEKTTRELARSQKEYNNVLLEGSKNAQSEIVSLQLTKKAIENVNIPLDERNRLVDDLQEEYPKYFANLTNEQILAGQVGNAYSLLKEQIIAASLARAAQDKIVENSQKKLDNEEKLIELEKERVKARKDAINLAKSIGSGEGQGFGGSQNQSISLQNLNAQSKINDIIKEQNKIKQENISIDNDNLRLVEKIGVEIEKSGAEILIGNKGREKTNEELKKILQSEIELQLFRANALSDIQKRIVDDENLSTEERLNALSNYVGEQQKILEIERKQSLSEEKLNKFDKIKIDEEFNKKSLELDLSASQDSLKILKDGLDLENKTRLEANEKALNELDINRDTELLILEESFLRGEKSREDYEKDKIDIQKNYNQLSIAEEIRQTEAIIELQKQRGESTSGAEAELAALKLKYSKEATDAQIADLKRLEDAENLLKEKRQELAGELFNLTESLFQAGFEKQQERVAKQIEESEQQADFERQRVEESLLTEDEKQIRLAQIDAAAQVRKESLERRQRQIAVQQARFEKAAAILRIGSQTAVAVISALTPPPVGLGPLAGIPLAATVGAIGAAQIAQVLATPIPGFYKGTESSPEGFAYVGEQGYEGRRDPDGTFSITPPTKTLTYLKKGTEIISAPKLKQMIASPDKNYSGATQISMSEVIDAVKGGARSTEKAIKNIVIPPSTQITKSGWLKTQMKNNGWNDYINRNTN